MPKLQPEDPNSLGIILSNFRGFPQVIFADFVIIFEAEMLESPPNLQNTRIVAKNMHSPTPMVFSHVTSVF